MDDVCPICEKNQKPSWRKYCSPECAHLAAVRAFNKRRRDAKLCVLCGGPLENYLGLCDRHARVRRIRQRKSSGYKPWKVGSPGQKPKALRKAP